MSSDDTDDALTYKVVVNHEEHYWALAWLLAISAARP
jgi:hypothetical protein